MPDPIPIDLDNMRFLGSRSIDLICGCGRHSEVNVDRFPGSSAVAGLTRFFRCSECGERPKTARPGKMSRDTTGGAHRPALAEREPPYLPGDDALLLR